MGDIARWLQALCFEFGEEYRPVPLHIHVEPMPFRHKNYYLFDRDLCKKLFGIIQQFSSGLPALVFCSSRKGCLDAAHAIIEAAQQSMQPLVSDMQQKHILQSASKEFQTGSLRDVICKVSWNLNWYTYWQSSVSFHSATSVKVEWFECIILYGRVLASTPLE